MRLNLKTIVFFFVVFTNDILAQTDDFGLWLDAAVNKKIASSELTLQSEFFTHDNNHSIDRFSIGLEGSRDIFSIFNISAGYLLMNKNNSDNYELRHRFYTNTKIQYDVSNIELSFRERFQVTRYSVNMVGASKYLNYWRNRMRISYDIPSCDIKPMIGAETFVPLNKPALNWLDEVRYSLSVIYPLTDAAKIELYGLLSKQIDVNQYILGVSYQISL